MLDGALGRVLEAISALPATPVLAVCGLLLFAETAVLAGIVVPATSTALGLGAFAAVGTVPLPAALAVGAVAVCAGDACGYVIGRRLGPRLLPRLNQLRHPRARTTRQPAALSAIGRPDSRPRSESITAALSASMSDGRGMVAVAGGRWVGFVRTAMPHAAGAAGLPPHRFFAANLPSAAAWAVTFVLLGSLAGTAIPGGGDLTQVSHIGAKILLGLAIGAAVVVVVRHRPALG